MVSTSNSLANAMGLLMVSWVSPCSPMMKSPWMTKPSLWQSLWISRFVSDDEQPASRFLHGLQGFVVGSHARSAGPRQSERLQLGAQLDSSRLLNIERVVVKEKFSNFRPVLLDLRHLGRNIVGGTLAPRMSAQSLRPQTKRTLRRTAARGGERNVGVQQKR